MTRPPNTRRHDSDSKMCAILMFGVMAAAVQTALGATITLTPDLTLSGQELAATRLKMTLNTDNEYLTVNFTAPYFAGDSATNQVHLFLADENRKITEVEFTPSGTTLRLYWAPFNVLRVVSADGGESKITASATLSGDGKTWEGTARVHRDLLPPRISLLNAANVHPVSATNSELQYDNLYAITNYGVALPDLMVLPRYRAIGPRFLFNNDGGYSQEWKAAN